MRIVIDMQGAQTDSRFRGIGRYTMAFAQAVVRNRGEHEVILVLNGLFPETIAPIRNAFNGILRQVNILVWCAPGPVMENVKSNATRLEVAQLIREAFLAKLQPDMIHISSLFEGYEQDAITSIGCLDPSTPVSVSLYDLIPLVNASEYLEPNPPYAKHYLRKIEHLKRAKLYLSISEFSRQEAITHLGLSAIDCINVSTAIDSHFQPLVFTGTQVNDLHQRFGLTGSFLLCTGAADARKNLSRLIQAYAKLPKALRSNHQLFFAGKMTEDELLHLQGCAQSVGLQKNELLFTGYVSDDELVQLYNLCKLYVFPSWHEGFGLPALEAMACGAPVIASNTTSLPEVIGLDAATFDPFDVKSISNKILQALEDDDFRNMLREHGLQQAKLFSWHDTAKRAMAAWVDQAKEQGAKDESWLAVTERTQHMYKMLIEKIATLGHKLDDSALKQIATCLAQNNQQIFSNLRNTTLPERLVWRVEGPFDSSYSLALVNREMARALFALGHQVVLHSTEGPGDFKPNPKYLKNNPDLAQMYQLEATISGYDAHVTSRNLYPPRVSGMHSRMNSLHAYGWEESGFPLDWADEFNLNLQGMTVMSNHVKKIMVDHGVTVPVAVSSLGVDHWERVVTDKNYFIQAKSFRFLHVSSCFPRKGAEVMLRAFGRAFRATDDVTLIIKTFANPHHDIRNWLEDLRKYDPDFPDVQIIETDLTEGQLKALYAQSHVLVAPSRAEGFGLPMAEAMLSGLAVITTGWSGQTDFCTDETAWLIDYNFVRAQSHFGLFASAWAEPDENHLTRLFNEVYQTPVQQRHTRIEAGKKLLLNQFRWSDAAARVVESARQWSGDTAISEVRIAWVTTWHTKCGIATYSEHLIRNMADHVTILAARENNILTADDGRVSRCWTAGEGDTLTDLAIAIKKNKCNTLVVQFNYGFFNLEHFAKFLKNQLDLGIKVVVTLHATSDPTSAPHKKLSLISQSLMRCERVLVHSINDLNRLKKLGLLDNVTLFPLGVLDNDIPFAAVKPLNKLFTVASYGFFLPHKGLLELIDAISLIHTKGMKVNLIMVNAEYPIAESKALVVQAQRKIAQLGLHDVVTLCADYLTDEESLNKIALADLVIYPYQETAESASAAVRYGLASEKPVAVTPLKIFDDVTGATYTLPGFTPSDLAQGIIAIEESIRLDSVESKDIRKQATCWKEQHKYSRLGIRLSGILQAIFRNEM